MIENLVPVELLTKLEPSTLIGVTADARPAKSVVAARARLEVESFFSVSLGRCACQKYQHTRVIFVKTRLTVEN